MTRKLHFAILHIGSSIRYKYILLKIFSNEIKYYVFYIVAIEGTCLKINRFVTTMDTYQHENSYIFTEIMKFTTSIRTQKYIKVGVLKGTGK